MKKIIQFFKGLFAGQKAAPSSDFGAEPPIASPPPLKLRPWEEVKQAYREEHAEALDGVLKAYFAYHTKHFQDHPRAHSFTGTHRDCPCEWCGRTRELVRWDDLPPQCQERPELPDIADTIQGEEEKAFALYEKAASEVPRIVAKLGMNGTTLAILHHTHGYDPETVSSVVEVPPQMIAQYHEAMETERARSRADTAMKRKVILARTEA